MQDTMISIPKNFSENPAGRYRTDGPNSGQRFREDWLLPALQSSSRVTVDLDGALGFGSSFLEEAFGGLVRAGFKGRDLHDKLEILSKTSMYKSRIWHYIDEASSRKFGAGK
ncbi:STAS-like domain-containing protein [Janthinobacterium sp. AD80]|uniref:STAS-like domain-containing protein n=1 Tax=Janthinobacterium sp. AD80 TaxID=1528773 RepID=UPI000C83A41A|nr:STAS-like domain-containing protein [Janthinobacterium sp. AD80]